MAKILIVDDDRHFIQQTRRLLTGFGYESDFITGTERLFPKLERQAVDLILLDIHMPSTYGVILLKELKAHRLHRTIPVIMLTVEVDEQVLVDCFGYGATDFITKPVQELVLKARIQAALDARKAKEALKESVSLLRATIESTADGILVVDNQGKFASFNQKFAELWHIPDEILARGSSDQALAFVVDQLHYPNQFISKVRKLYAQPEAESFDVLHFKDGRIFERYSRSQRIDDRIVGRVWSFRDITEQVEAEEKLQKYRDHLEELVEERTAELARTVAQLEQEICERKRAEESLHESEEKYRTLFESSRDAILLLEPGKGYIDCNPAALQLFGIESKKYLSDLSPDVLSPQYQSDGFLSSERAEQMIATALENGSHFFAWSHRRLNGEDFPATVLATRLRLGGRDILQGTIRDITEQKQTEEELKKHRDHLEELVKERTADLEKANRELKETQAKLVQSAKLASVGELATGVAHELNQPLMYIRSNAQLETLQGPEHLNPQTAYETLKIVEEGTDRMMKIINHLRNFARQNDFGLEPVDLNEVLEESFTMFNEQFRFSSILIEKDYDKQLPAILGNVNQLEQVFINMLSNARDALTEREDAMLKIRTELRPAEDGAREVVVRFADNGRGIPESVIDKIFDPFFTTKKIGEGTGLGLSISYGIVKDHKGDISVSGVEGEGTTFEISLPAINASSIFDGP